MFNRKIYQKYHFHLRYLTIVKISSYWDEQVKSTSKEMILDYMEKMIKMIKKIKLTYVNATLCVSLSMA